jgi:hypothetical protein
MGISHGHKGIRVCYNLVVVVSTATQQNKQQALISIQKRAIIVRLWYLGSITSAF